MGFGVRNMKTMDENLAEEGFEELSAQDKSAPATGGNNRPDMRVVQVEVDKDGKTVYSNVGGMWKNVSKAGNEFYTLKIGNLKLLVFPNKNK